MTEETGIRQMVVAGNLFWGAVRINQRGQQQLQPIFAGFEPEARILCSGIITPQLYRPDASHDPQFPSG